MNEILILNASLYASRFQIEIGETLGSGKDGIVLVAKRKGQPAKVAIKVLRWTKLTNEKGRCMSGSENWA